MIKHDIQKDAAIAIHQHRINTARRNKTVWLCHPSLACQDPGATLEVHSRQHVQIGAKYAHGLPNKDRPPTSEASRRRGLATFGNQKEPLRRHVRRQYLAGRFAQKNRVPIQSRNHFFHAKPQEPNYHRPLRFFCSADLEPSFAFSFGFF